MIYSLWDSGKISILYLCFFSHHGIGIERHDHPSHAEIGHSQGDDEVVGDVLQGLLLGHREDNQDVTEHHGDTEHQHQQGPVVLVVERISSQGRVIFILSSFCDGENLV